MPSLGGAAKGAATGAGLGSFIPGIGTGIGAGIGGLIGLFTGGGKKKEDKPAAQPEDQYTALLKQQSSDLRTTGEGYGSQSQEALTPVLNYFKSLLGDNGAALMEATKPQRGRVIDQYNTALKTAAEFGPRGGGTTSAAAQGQFDKAAQLSDITASARADAAGKAGSLGVSLAGLGLSADQLAGQDLNTLINAVLAREGLNVQKRGQTMELWGGIGEAAGSIIGGILAGGKD